MARVILFGGSFDPVHHGHLIVARAAREALRADSVLFIPANMSPHKIAPTRNRDAGMAAHRLAMLRLAMAAAGEKEGALEVSDVELLRPGPSYTFDTVEELAHQRPGDSFILLMGADQLSKLHTWHRVEDLLHRVIPAVVGRPGAVQEADLVAVQERMGPETADRLRAGLLPTPLIEISATDIRQRIAAGLPVTFLLPPAVEAYIAEHHLYTAIPSGR